MKMKFFYYVILYFLQSTGRVRGWVLVAGGKTQKNDCLGSFGSGSNVFSPTVFSSSTPSSTSLFVSSYLDSLPTVANHVSSGSPTESISTSLTSSCLPPSSSEFQYVPVLSLEQADAIANCSIQCCLRNAFSPVTVYVLDSSGHTLVSKRMDGCSAVGIPDFAQAKAFSCIVNKYPSRTFRDRYTQDEASAKFCQMTSMVAISEGRMAPFPGGILIKLKNHIIGAVGVSGAAGDEDEYCAIRGVMESGIVGLSTVPETHSCSTIKD